MTSGRVAAKGRVASAVAQRSLEDPRLGVDPRPRVPTDFAALSPRPDLPKVVQSATDLIVLPTYHPPPKVLLHSLGHVCWKILPPILANPAWL